ncbi:uncharacterized protein LOC118200127 [Stegodyphus dumicola]|uniref:uncharacterized protein LOC118200127 n=1 Tax=Stegodyphus dumicola TaxID=202533 RepID=UPI0015B056E5|nr:uncharacterized protein LOC118200127 [Stegodyphus dumicola]
MSQKSILSFFKHTDKGKSSNEDSKSAPAVENNSPVKKVAKRKRVKQLIESDEDSRDIEKSMAKVSYLGSKTENGCNLTDQSNAMEVAEDGPEKKEMNQHFECENGHSPSMPDHRLLCSFGASLALHHSFILLRTLSLWITPVALLP